MISALLIGAIVGAAASGLVGLPFARASRAGERLSAAVLGVSCVAGLVAAGLVVADGPVSFRAAWAVPGGELALRVDAVSAMFLIQIFGLSLAGDVYGLGYYAHATHPAGRKLRAFYGLMTAGMAVVASAQNTVLFLAGWEVMAVAAFFCVATEDEKKEVREAAYVYIVSTHLGTLTLFGLFGLLHTVNGDFELALPAAVSPAMATAIFATALFGFGVKAGIMPLHFWLPGAHANAPSHVSAVMSGVLIKMGVYGIVRVASLFPHPPAWWGALVLVLGVVSGVLGVAFAIGQHDLKRLLAYHSVENIGIICMGLGVALLGRAYGMTALVVLGLSGAMLHVWNHGLFKGLLFLSAGSVIHGVGTREIDRMGGLARRMPWTAALFLVGAVAISGLPPLNGFVSELLVYLGLGRAVVTKGGSLWLTGVFAAPGLALIGALAVACFVKVYGTVFSGEPRTDAARRAHESGPAMLLPMAALAAACAFIGLASPLLAPLLERVVAAWAPELAGRTEALAGLAPLGWVSLGAAALLLGVAALWALLAAQLRQAARGAALGTWDCGYAAPTARMQYTSSSFAQLIVDLFGRVLGTRVHLPRLATASAFPRASAFHSHVPEPVLDRALLPLGHQAMRAFRLLHYFQRGSVHAYLAYILVVLLGLLILR